MCDEVIRANEYSYLKLRGFPTYETESADLATINYQRSALLDGVDTENESVDPDPSFLHYNEQEVYMEGEHRQVKMFPCLNTLTRVSYVTYAFKENEMFLIEMWGSIKTLKMTGIIESNASFDRELSTQEALASLKTSKRLYGLGHIRK